VSVTELKFGDDWVRYCEDELGYTSVKLIDNGVHYAAVAQFAYTAAIIVGEVGDETGYSDRWCYHTVGVATVFINLWDGEGEPIGWHRHPKSGRRRAETDNCIDEKGRRVPVGEMYIYH
jgi:hypothetical protein